MSLSLWERVAQRTGVPLGVMLVVTNRCNLSCPHCHRSRHTDGELSTGELVSVLDQMAQAGVFRITITGGEPLLRDDLPALIEEAHRLRFIVHLKTNGTRMTGELARRLWELGLSSMDVSLYSVDGDAHDRFVGQPGAFAASCAALDAFAAAGGEAVANMVVMGWNEAGVSAMLDLCESRGWKWGLDGRIARALDGSTAPLQFQASPEALARVFSEGRVRQEDPLLSAEACRHGDDDQVCGAGTAVVVILPDGEVWPCLTLPWSMGNVRCTPFRDIVVNSPVVERIRNIRWADSPACVTCDVAGLCHRCPAEAFRAHGDEKGFTSADCLLAEARAMSLGLPRGPAK